MVSLLRRMVIGVCIRLTLQFEHNRMNHLNDLESCFCRLKDCQDYKVSPARDILQLC